MNAEWRSLHHIHAAARQQFRYVPDQQAYGAVDHWLAPDELRRQLAGNGFVLGDCDDFASLCVMLARQQGLPARFVLCITETGESHLVAEVNGWVLDNRMDDVVSRDDLGYTWLAISGHTSGAPWHLIENGEQHA